MNARMALLTGASMAIVAALSVVLLGGSGHAGFVPGDVDCNGSVDSVDASLILQLHGGLVTSLPCEGAADVNGDGFVDSLDASLVLQWSGPRRI